MLEAIIALAALGLIFGLVLGLASKKLKVEVDPTVEKLIEVLPGANCGACGYPGCSGLAEAIAAGKANIDSCIPGGKETADNVADIMGMSSGDCKEPLIARVQCQGTVDKSKYIYEYEGIPSCDLAANYFNGSKDCQFGCFGLGTCAASCPFDAITMGEDNLPKIDMEKCTGCGVCVEACPQNIIRLGRATQRVFVSCSNTDKGKDSRKVCTISCIKCRICEKGCPSDAIHVIQTGTGTIARIDEEKCTNCGWCADNCPTGAIQIIEPLEEFFNMVNTRVPVKEEESKSGCAACGLCK